MQNDELRRAQHELGVSCEKYSDLYDLAPVGYLTLNEPGRILEANLTAARLLGVARTDLVRQPLTRFILREDLDIFYQHRQRLFETRAPQSCELRLTRPGGAPFWVRGEAILAQDHKTGAPVCRMTLSDITGRKQADETLTRQLEILNATPDFIGFADARDTRILYINPAGRKMIGWGPEEDVTRLKMAEVHPAWTNRLFREQVLPIAIRDGVWKGDAAFLRRDGREIPVTMVLLAHKSPGGKLERFSTISRDLTERKQAEADRERLAQFERLAQLMKCANDIVLLTDGDGRILEANDRALETYGYSLAELRQKTIEDLRTPESRAELPHQIEQLETDGRAVFETMNQRRDRAAFPVEISARFIEIAGVPHRLSIVRDITRRKRAEEALQESSLFNQQIIRSAREGVIVYGCDHRYQVWNTYMEQLTGIPASQVLGRLPLEVFPFLRQAGALERLERALSGEALRPIDFPYHIPQTGRSGWVSHNPVALLNPHGEIIGAIVTVHDITERKRTEAAQRESEERNRAILQTAMDGFCQVDLQGRLLEVNEAYCRMSGYSEQELLTMHTSDLEAVETHADTAAHIQRVMARGEGRFESRHRRKDGSTFAVEVSVQYKPAEGGQMIAFLRDITERKQAEKRMQMFSQEIIAAREEERKQVSSVLHHDVGSLTVGISAHFDAIEQDLRSGKPGEALQWMNRTRKLFDESVARLKGLAVELRPPELDVLGLRAALRQHFAQVTERGGARIHFRETLGRRRVPGDTATILFRVAQEALTNAITHGHATRVEVTLSASKKEVGLTIRNNGKGFNPSEQRARAASQMGLRVMREMAVSVGGAFTLDSGPGKDTTVRVRLPLSRKPQMNTDSEEKDLD
jgi:PAS domain S-box-containing protein